jgi:two-component system LytT family response regulator
LARLRLSTYLRKVRPDCEIREAENGFQAIELVETFAPELVFLDVEMPEMTVLQFLLHFESRPFKVIFQTAFDEFAVKAFEENAVDYLLKPFSDERLAKALERAGLDKPTKSTIESHLISSKVYLDKLIIKAGSKRKIIEVKDILSIRSESHVTRIFLSWIDYSYDYPLTFLEERLDPHLFVRIHRNVIVALQQIKTVDLGAKAHVVTKDGEILSVSRERKKILAEAINV